MVLPQSAAEHYRTQQRLTVGTLALVRREWAGMGQDFDASWATVGPRVALLTASAQLCAARLGAEYVGDVLAEQGSRVEPVAQVNARAFSGVAADGRPLDSLLYEAVIAAKAAPVTSAVEALAVGGRALDMYVHTTVADAGRAATSVGVAVRPRVQWTRIVNPPSCKRCAILAGRVYRWSQGFQRHPRCDCTMLPTTVADPDQVAADAQALFDTPGMVKDTTAAERNAIADGADLSQVVNATRKGAGMTTTEGTTRRGLAGQRNPGRQRLTPDGIYRLASDRTQALALLKAHGYVI